jgi:hypothetical protein
LYKINEFDEFTVKNYQPKNPPPVLSHGSRAAVAAYQASLSYKNGKRISKRFGIFVTTLRAY